MTRQTSAPSYPAGSVRELIESDLVTLSTRNVLQARLQTADVIEPRFFDPVAFKTLRAVCDRLLAQPERPHLIDVCGTLDTRLARGEGDGWRFADMPPDADAHRNGLVGIEQVAMSIFGRAFTQLNEAEQDDVLRAIQHGTASTPVWVEMNSRRYFEELLAAVVDIYYAHPLASEEIGYAGMADAHGWQAIGLGQHEAHEPVAVHPLAVT